MTAVAERPASIAPSRLRRWSRGAGGKRVIRGAIGVLVLLAIVEAASLLGIVPSSVLPSASSVLAATASLLVNPVFLGDIGRVLEDMVRLWRAAHDGREFVAPATASTTSSKAASGMAFSRWRRWRVSPSRMLSLETGV